ncbi:DUF2971 domain-containing protein [Pectobacteriaceae bacterium CE90]|nr:DUF2971 domain-containing protein [Pectobacteriaceae bacterium CE90]
MILYKYVTSDIAMKIIKNPTLKFTPPGELNDPFETSSLYYESHNMEYVSEENEHRSLSVKMSYGVLSLSRNPLNPLMWSHYAKGKKEIHEGVIRLDIGNESHGGMVIGFDTELAELDNKSKNVIPANMGSVIYTTTKPTSVFDNSEYHPLYEGMITSYRPDIFEALQRTFLYKSAYWSYEEEVRVIRNLGRTQPLREQEIDSESIKEIYIGCRNSSNINYLTCIYNLIKERIPNCAVYACSVNDRSWFLDKKEVEKIIQLQRETNLTPNV